VNLDDLEPELKWLQAHPEFEERPATIKEFVGPNYLNIEKRVRKSILKELVAIMGEESDGYHLTRYQRAMITGGIGIGKTTIASIVLPYLAHWVLCLQNPQEFFELLPGSRIAFMQMSTSGPQAKQVVFGDIKARIDHSPWFQSKYPYDKNFKTQLRFNEKEVWILPGDSAETTFEGYNILGGILDEADSHQVTDTKDYAEQGYTTIYSRITSRFEERGFILVIGQMKKGNGFAAKKYKEFLDDPGAYAVRMAIWESFGWDRYLNEDGTRDSFWYDTKRHDIIPSGAAKLIKGSTDNLIEIPNTYKQDFLNNPEKALRDLAGIPPLTGSPFISLTYKITEARERWLAHQNPGYVTGSDELVPVITSPVDAQNRMADWFRCQDPLKRVAHIDLAYSANGDGLGLAMGHVRETVEIDGEHKPYIVIDLVMRIHAPAGREIFLGDVRRIIYWLRDERKFRITKVTMDGFQSTDTMQQLERKRIQTELVSVDKQMLPYYDLREAIYEDRIEFPQYLVKLNESSMELTEVLVKELEELVDNGTKVDHPHGGSKDIADAVAGVTYTLMGDRTYSRKVVRLDALKGSGDAVAGEGLLRPELVGGIGAMRAPLPPVGATSWNPPSRGRSR
jgi:hypothetical protein